MGIARRVKYVAISRAEAAGYKRSVGAERFRRHMEIFYSGRAELKRRPPGEDGTVCLEHPLMDGEIRSGFAAGEPKGPKSAAR